MPLCHTLTPQLAFAATARPSWYRYHERSQLSPCSRPCGRNDRRLASRVLSFSYITQLFIVLMNSLVPLVSNLLPQTFGNEHAVSWRDALLCPAFAARAQTSLGTFCGAAFATGLALFRCSVRWKTPRSQASRWSGERLVCLGLYFLLMPTNEVLRGPSRYLVHGPAIKLGPGGGRTGHLFAWFRNARFWRCKSQRSLVPRRCSSRLSCEHGCSAAWAATVRIISAVLYCLLLADLQLDTVQEPRLRRRLVKLHLQKYSEPHHQSGT